MILLFLITLLLLCWKFLKIRPILIGQCSFYNYLTHLFCLPLHEYYLFAYLMVLATKEVNISVGLALKIIVNFNLYNTLWIFHKLCEYFFLFNGQRNFIEEQKNPVMLLTFSMSINASNKKSQVRNSKIFQILIAWFIYSHLHLWVLIQGLSLFMKRKYASHF